MPSKTAYGHWRAFWSVSLNNDDVIAALETIIDGEIVKRDRHTLEADGEDLSALFIQRLIRKGYRWLAVADTALVIGSKCPAFIVQERTAVFGWVKWMKYDVGIYRKFFASEWRKPSGTPVLILAQNETVFVNDGLTQPHDPDAPPVFE